MFTRKKKILFVSEASYSKTGFGRYYHDLLSRLHALGKYRIAELGCFGHVNFPGDSDIIWRFYANQVTSDDARYNRYIGDSLNKLGKWRFDTVLLDFEPDFVIDLRDPPMFGFESMSGLREYFHWIVSPPVDSAPQSNDFLGLYYSADDIVPYTDYGYQVISSEAPGTNLRPPIYPGISDDVFKPMSSNLCREKYGLPTDKKIIGTVMRNQIRKMIPNLFSDFRSYLDASGRDDIVLHIHTTYPDLHPWNIPKHIIEQGVYDKVFFTYNCHACGAIFINKWQEDNVICPHCKNHAGSKNKVNQGPNNHQLAEIYNCYDLYVQYSSSEGLGVPVIEAAKCGVPTMGIDSTAVSDVLRLTGGVGLKPLAVQRDINTDALRAIPDPSEFISACLVFFNQTPEQIRAKKEETLALARQNFDPDKNAKQWEELIDSIEPKNAWGKPQKQINKVDLTNFEPTSFYNLAYTALSSSEPDSSVLHHYYFDEYIIKPANYGFMLSNKETKSFNSQDIIDWLQKYMTEKKTLEAYRVGLGTLNNDDYLDYAEAKEIANLTA